jgi:serine/threonine protein kinase
MGEDAKALLEQYELISKIGSGGFGTVSKAWNRTTGSVVAIKHIHLRSGSSGRSNEIPSSVQREIDALKEFGSDPTAHILPLIDSIYDPSHRSLYLIFKYYPYDLRALARANQIPLSRAIPYIRGICEALHVLHQGGYVHRDVKPENVFVGTDHEIALGDFGLAREVRPPMTTGSGTLPYRAPEELLGDVEYGYAVDMWALGCVMYCLIFGNVPFEGKSDADQIHQICSKLGSPSTINWPRLRELPNAGLYLPRRPIVREDFKTMVLAKLRGGDQGSGGVMHAYVDLMAQMLQWNPLARITAEGALLHDVFSDIAPLDEPIVIKELHQRERAARPFCDFLFEAFEADLEFPRFVPPCEV